MRPFSSTQRKWLLKRTRLWYLLTVGSNQTTGQRALETVRKHHAQVWKWGKITKMYIIQAIPTTQTEERTSADNNPEHYAAACQRKISISRKLDSWVDLIKTYPVVMRQRAAARGKFFWRESNRAPTMVWMITDIHHKEQLIQALCKISSQQRSQPQKIKMCDLSHMGFLWICCLTGSSFGVSLMRDSSTFE